ncbi:hypothetical protein DICPUDRAFT_152543 [Dictyostelium purpureum]|uniref:non-specific serine/threonine protein kinase n=1 Tax=Dictyostelium purpureum TaxID=5786 RepID=F0ZLM6_DICPU|nr:uncharacterized protein DICPUDRAFT_152543 [Dictyostelium purpureum]EGC35140.1 hypothetical protein DICPUDRAFT_152543 [Dictyostelium purpureum]|eukprot:XP_003288333.1 hypothetical protein DICPUDRAFT_152543 [Dictyostelium purpureum]
MNISFSRDGIEGLPTSSKDDDDSDLSSIEYEDLVMDSTEIGRGSFGQVQKASYFGTDVAVKQLSSLVSIDPDYFKFMLREIKILKNMRHPNIVQYIGACCNEGRYMIVTEYIKGGDLHQFIKKRGVSNISWTIKLKLALDIASAFSYLHSKKVIFRDLKAKNILIDEIGDTLRAKVCDFGFARIFDSNKDKAQTICGSETTMAPEVIVGSNYNESCDIYSYGVLLLELICGSRVVKTQLKRTPMNAFDMKLDKAEYLAPEHCPRDFIDLAKWCCSYSPKDRPSFKNIVEGLKQLSNTPLSSLKPKGKSKPYIDSDDEDFVDPNENNSNEDIVNNNNDSNNSHSVIIKTDEPEYSSVVYKEDAIDQPLPNIDYGGLNNRKNNIFNPSFFTPPPGSKPLPKEEEEEDAHTLSYSLSFDQIKYHGSHSKSLSSTISTPNLISNPIERDPPKPLSQSASATVLGGVPPQQQNKKRKNKNKNKKK